MTFGVTSSGFNLKRFDDIRESLVSRAGTQAQLIGMNTDAETVFGQLIDIMSAEMSDMWEMGLAVSQITNPESVEGVLLDNAGAFVGVERQEAAATSTYIRYIGDDLTELTTAVKVSVPNEDKSFSPDADYIIDSSQPVSYVKILFTANTSSNPFSVNIDGNTVTYSGSPTLGSPAASAAALYTEIDADPSVNTIVDAYIDPEDVDFETVIIESLSGSFNFQFTNLATTWSQDEAYGVSLPSSCTRDGAVALALGEATDITETVTGLSDALNTTVGVLGRKAETDEEFRFRRRNSLSIIGSGTLDSIIDNVNNLDGVTRTTGVENETGSTDAGGRPTKSFEIIVTGGEDQEIAELIWKLKPAGIQTYGLINGGSGITVLDTQGNEQSVEFSRPVERALSVLIEYTVYAEETQPTNIQTAIDTAVLSYAATLIPGKDIIPQRFGNAVMNGVSGLQFVKAYVKVSADATSPAAPNTGTDDVIVALDERDYGSLDQVDITYAVV